MDYNSQKRLIESMNERIKTYRADIEKADKEVGTLVAKLDDLKIQAKNYSMNSDSFIKFLVDGSISITGDRFKGKAGNTYSNVVDAIAELKGNEIKWA
ncbi:MAG: hypothetical protein FD129_2990 [bacterium]|nr:MAG: hypothetical protein FD129_2990 [bacterium]